MSLNKERKDELRENMRMNPRAVEPCDMPGQGEVLELLDMADERDDLEKAVDPRNKRPSGMSIVQLAEWKTYLASVRDRVLTLVSPHSRDEDADADETVERLIDERDRYRALLRAAIHFLSTPNTTGLHSPDFCGSRQDLVSKIDAALHTDKTKWR